MPESNRSRAGGTTICASRGNATAEKYEYNDLNPEYSYTIKKLSRSCRLKKGKLYFVNLLPTYSDDNISCVSQGMEEPAWSVPFNDPMRGAYYVQCSALGTLDEFSIALTGN